MTEVKLEVRQSPVDDRYYIIHARNKQPVAGGFKNERDAERTAILLETVWRGAQR